MLRLCRSDAQFALVVKCLIGAHCKKTITGSIGVRLENQPRLSRSPQVAKRLEYQKTVDNCFFSKVTKPQRERRSNVTHTAERYIALRGYETNDQHNKRDNIYTTPRAATLRTASQKLALQSDSPHRAAKEKNRTQFGVLFSLVSHSQAKSNEHITYELQCFYTKSRPFLSCTVNNFPHPNSFVNIFTCKQIILFICKQKNMLTNRNINVIIITESTDDGCSPLNG